MPDVDSSGLPALPESGLLEKKCRQFWKIAAILDQKDEKSIKKMIDHTHSCQQCEEEWEFHRKRHHQLNEYVPHFTPEESIKIIVGRGIKEVISEIDFDGHPGRRTRVKKAINGMRNIISDLILSFTSREMIKVYAIGVLLLVTVSFIRN